jgi:amidase
MRRDRSVSADAGEVIVGNEPQPADCWVPGSFSLPATAPGPLTGATLAVKDMFAIEGHVSSFGHARWRETHSPWKYTAPVLARLLAAGASVTGLAKLDQLAWSIVGNVGEGVAPLNPLYPDRFTCGSSSGPASAVGAGLADLGLGTDTGGSVRAPAAACGLYGLRPTHGLISTEGVLPLAPSFDTVGVMTRHLALLGLAIEVMAELPASEVTTQVVVPVDCLDGVGQATVDAVRAVAAALGERVARPAVEEDLGSFVNAEVTDLFARIQARQVWTMHGPWLASNRDVLAPDVASRVARAQELAAGPEDERAEDKRTWQAFGTALSARVPPGEVVVMPVIPDLPLLRTASADEVQAYRVAALRFTTAASLSGRPELVIPVRHGRSGKCVGVGILGCAGSDAELVRLAGLIVPDEGVLAV